MQELNASQNAVAGLACGTIEVCINQPMLYWKNAAQQNLPFTLNPKFVYRGLLASIANMASLTALQFFGTGIIKRAIVDGEDRPLSEIEEMSSAFIGGALSGIVCGPLELTMIQQQRFGGNIIGTPMQIVRETGLLGMARGMWPSIIREGIFTCGYLGATPVLQKKFSNNEKLAFLPVPVVQFIAAMSAGFVASGLSHPADTIKTCMQGDIQQSTYTRMVSGLRLIVNRDGFQGLYKGFIWRYLRMGATFFIFNLTMTPVSRVLFPAAFADEREEEVESLQTETKRA